MMVLVAAVAGGVCFAAAEAVDPPPGGSPATPSPAAGSASGVSLDRLVTLTPELARALIDERAAGNSGVGRGGLALPAVESLSPEVARELANNRGVWVELTGLRELSPAAARALEGYRGPLRIRCPGGRLTPELLGLMTTAGYKANTPVVGTEWTGITFALVGLETLTPEDVAKLAEANPFNPSLGGIRRLEPEAARAIVTSLAKHHVYLPDLEEMPLELAAGSFSNKNLQVWVNGGSLRRMSLDVAKALVAGGQENHLMGLQAISPEVAEVLLLSNKTRVTRAVFEKDWDLVRRLSPAARAKLENTAIFEYANLTTIDAADAAILASLGNVSLPKLTALSGEAAAALAASRGRLALPALANLSPEVARGLSSYKGGAVSGWISLPAVANLTPEAARALVAGAAKIDLPGIKRLTADVAAALASGTQAVELYGIRAFDAADAAETARALATKRGDLALPNLRRISPKALTRLIAKEDIVMPPIESLVLIDEPDGSPTDDFVMPDGFAAAQRGLQRSGPDRRREARVAFPLADDPADDAEDDVRGKDLEPRASEAPK